MSRLAQAALQKKQYDEQQKKLQDAADKQARVAAGGDGRDTANKIYDALNPFDSGRSFTTATPSTDASKKSSGEQAKDALVGMGKSFAAPFKRFGEGGAEVVNELTGNADKERAAQQKAQDDATAMMVEYNKKAKAETDPAKKARLQKVADMAKKNSEDAYKSATARNNEIIDRTDPVKGAAAVGEIGFDVLTAGTGGAALQGGKEAAIQGGKEVAKEGAKQVAETVAKQGAKDVGEQVAATGGRMAAKKIAQTAATAGWQGGVAGGLGAVEDKGSDVSLKDVATGALTGAAGGALFGAGTSAVGELGGAALRKILPKNEGGYIKNPFFHSTTADNVDSILSDGKLRVGQQVDEVGKPVVSNEFDSKPGVFGDTESGTAWHMPDKENVEIAYDQKALKDYGLVKQEGGTQAVVNKDLPVTPDTVAAVKVGTEETAQKFRDGGFKNVIVDETLDKRPKAEKNVVMAAEVEPPTEASLSAEVQRPTRTPAATDNMTLSEISDSAKQRPSADIQKSIEEAHNAGDNAKVSDLITQLPADEQPSMRSALGLPAEEPKVQLKVLNDVQKEADVRSPGDSTVPHNQAVETKTQKGAQYLVDDIDKLQKDTGIDVTPVDRQAAAALTGEVRRSAFHEFKDKMGRNFQDTLTYAARTLGKNGTDFVYDMLAGNKFKRDALTALRQPMADLSKLNKKLSGTSLTARRDLGARIGAALDDRANAGNFLKTPQEQQLFDSYVKVFDYVKGLREKSGLETLENYRPWVDMKNAAEPPTWLSENITSKRTQTLSRYSKERTRTEVSDKVDNNLADMIYGYVNSQLNEMAYDAPVRKFKSGLDDLNSGNKANVGAMNEGIDYMRQLVQQAVNPERKNLVERAAGKLTSNVYGAVLPFNVRLALQNKSQQFIANSRVSKGAVRLAKKISQADAKELESGLVFGDSTVYGQLEDVNPTAAGKSGGLREKVAKVDPYQKSEHGNVITSYHKGAMQAVLESDPYKAARANGLKPTEAVSEALKDPAVKEAAIRRGNVVVNDTQFGASPLARPEMLREEGSIWGVIPKKTIYMFTRFPIGMSQHALEMLDNNNGRALEMLKNGDPRAVSISEMRTNYHALLSSMKDAKTAVKQGTDVGIPENVLNEQIKVVSDNLKTIDKVGKSASQIRGGKSVKNFAKMWAAAAVIQVIFDGGIQSFANDPVGTSADAIAKTNPTMGNRVVGQYSPLASISSSASPIDRYGKPNTRAIANYIPGVGLAVNRGRDIKKLYDSLTGGDQAQQ